ncbi:MAG: acetyl-CoA acetyltransferase [Chloroflexota bacterium]|nr:acetyl-CoA acetyltransferase [Chloroflexota bacterium]
MPDLRRTVAIVGAAESDEIGVVEHKSALQHHAEAAHNALEDAGLSKSDVDGLFTAGFSTLATGEYLGIRPHYTDTTAVGGSSFVIHVAHAMAAINAGYCEVALITHGQAGRSMRLRGAGGGGGFAEPNVPGQQYESPFGLIGPPVNYALACTRYMHQYGEDRTRQALAEIAVSTRKWAQLNPKAMMRDPMSFDDYHDSRWIVWPFHLLDCCLVTDAGASVVVTSAERARDLRKPPVWVLSGAESHDHAIVSQMPDLTSTVSRVTGPAALQAAGVTHDDIDLTMVYDSFTYTTLVTLEGLGFCGPGEGPDFVAGQRTAPGGDFPLNTSGGGLSYTHPGMYGIFLIIEAVRQLRGEAGDRQLDNPKLALVNGTGGLLSSTGTIVLAAD